MPDREKVIKALEFCQGSAGYECEDCPYDGECAKRPFAIEEDALALLREQESVEPIPTGIEPNYNCGACKMPIQQGYPFCPWCGKKVKWDA